MGSTMVRIATIAAAILLCIAPATAAQKSKQFIDNYDDLGDGLASQILVGPYHDLNYAPTWHVSSGNLVDGASGGVIPNSPRNTIGTMTNQNPAAEIFRGNTTCFDLKSLYLGCSIRSQSSQTPTAQQCAIALTGWKGKTSTGKATIFGLLSNPALNPMTYTQLDKKKFSCLTKATFTFINSTAGTPLLTVVKIDDLVHVNYYK